MARRRKGRFLSSQKKWLGNPRAARYLRSSNGKEGKLLRMGKKTQLWRITKGRTSALSIIKEGQTSAPSNIEILGEIARILTSPKILSGKINTLRIYAHSIVDTQANQLHLVSSRGLRVFGRLEKMTKKVIYLFKIYYPILSIMKRSRILYFLE